MSGAELIALQQAHHAQLLAVRELTASMMSTTWQRLGGFTDEALERFPAAAARLSVAAQGSTETLARAYMTANDRVIGRSARSAPTPAMIRNGVDPEDVYRRAVMLARRNLSDHGDPVRALKAGESRVKANGRTDVILANRSTIDAGRDVRPWVVGYRRVLTGKSCALCASASTQRYTTADLHPIHPNCDCDVAEIFGTEDPGQVVNQKLLDDLQAAGKEDGRPDYWNGPYMVDEDGVVRYRSIEYPIDPKTGKRLRDANGKLVREVKMGDPVVPRVEDHGELGATLTDRRHSFDHGGATAEPGDATRPGIVPDEIADAAPKVRKRRRVGVDDPEVVEMAKRYGVSPDEILVARRRIADLKAEIYESAERVQLEAFEQLDDWQARMMTRPPRNGRGGEWDFLEELSKGEKARLSRTFYTDNQGFAPDQIAESMRAFGNVPEDAGIQELMRIWMDTNRRYESAGAIRRGKLPSGRAYSDSVDVRDLIKLDDERYDVAHIMRADELEVAGHIASIDRQIIADDAIAYLGEAATPELGPAPFRMSFQAWEEEIRTLEFALREHPDEMSMLRVDAERRLRELAPPILDDGQDYEDLYASIVVKAEQSGMEIPAHVGIPWK